MIKQYNIMRGFKFQLAIKGFLKKAYVRNNLKEEDFKFSVKNDYKNKRVIIQFKRK